MPPVSGATERALSENSEPSADTTRESSDRSKPIRRSSENSDLDERIASLEAELAQLHRRRRARDDAAFLLTVARVVPAGVVFSAVELIAHARLDRALGQAIGTRTPKQLGHYLRVLARSPATGVILHRCDDRNNRGCMWSIGFTP